MGHMFLGKVISCHGEYQIGMLGRAGDTEYRAGKKDSVGFRGG